jgi:hypothetical protein
MTVNPKDDLGNVQVDFVWGNFPLQPDELRGEDTLDPTLDNHSIATTGYANYPSFLPNYAGDGDTDPEVLLPEFRRLSRSAAEAAADAVGLNLDVQYVTYDLLSVTSSGKAVTVVTDGDNLLAVTDVVSVLYNDGDGFSGTWSDVKITKKDATDSFTFNLPAAPETAYDFTSTGYVFNNAGIVLDVDGTTGAAVDSGATIPALVLNGD